MMNFVPVALLRGLWERHGSLLVLLGITLVAYYAALNRVSPLLWGLAALLSATLLVGVLLPGWLVRRLSVVRHGPQRAMEDETIELQVEVENRGWLPRFMVELVDHLPFIGAASGTPASAIQKLGLLTYVPGGSTRRFVAALRCEKRGFYQLGPAGLASSFPLGLAEARQQRSDGLQTLTIYPNVFPIVELPLHGSPRQLHRGNYLLPESAGTAEFSGLRDYRRGDNPRHVHWPTTARLNQLMIKECEPLASACLYLVLDQSSFAEVGEGKQTSFEYAVRIAASIANFACANNIPTRLVGQGRETLQHPAGSGAGHYQALLDALAVVAADGMTPYADVLQRVAIDCQYGETVVAFISEPRLRQTESLKALAALRGMGVNVLAMVLRRSSFPGRESSHDDTAMTVASLLEMGAICLEIEAGTDLLKLFNS